MLIPSMEDAFHVLCLQLADEGRAVALLGDCASRVRAVAPPFVIGKKFPSIYFEFPLTGERFLDVTLLYADLERGTRVASAAAEGTGEMLDWFADVCQTHEDINCGFELDTKNAELRAAAVHFQPRGHLTLVEPFFQIVGEPERARLYLDQARCMPRGWPLSFLGIFRGRPESPLRVCGYLGDQEKRACIEDEGHLAAVFDAVGFSAYDETMLEQIRTMMGCAPGCVDFQFDIYPDGSIGEVFAIDIQFGIVGSDEVQASFESGPISRVMEALEAWGAADERWRLAAGAAFTRAMWVTNEENEMVRYGFSLIPLWAKVRWNGGVLQPSKLYYQGSAGVM